MKIGVLHPGEMGAALASQIRDEVIWAGEGRSPATASRAADNGLTDVGTISELVENADIVISVCPPAAAVELAGKVSECGFEGVYLDANAVSPATSNVIAERFDRFVDGGIVGPPPTRPGVTRLYLSGAEAGVITEVFAGSWVDTRIIGASPGTASALKMAYASWTKGSSALLLAIAAMAGSNGVLGDLRDEWDMSIPELGDRLDRLAARVGAKAWRFEGEMRQISQTADEAGVPTGFFDGAGDVYALLAELKDGEHGQQIAEIVDLILGEG